MGQRWLRGRPLDLTLHFSQDAHDKGASLGTELITKSPCTGFCFPTVLEQMMSLATPFHK